MTPKVMAWRHAPKGCHSFACFLRCSIVTYLDMRLSRALKTSKIIGSKWQSYFATDPK
jgi:hypothetical protein